MVKQICKNCKFCIRVKEERIKNTKYFCSNYENYFEVYMGIKLDLSQSHASFHKLNDTCDKFEIRPKSCNYFLTFEVMYECEYAKYLQLELEEYEKENNWLKSANSALKKRMKKIIEIASKKRISGGFKNAIMLDNKEPNVKS